MALLALDLGGTKLALAVFNNDGSIISKNALLLGGRKGSDVGSLITSQISQALFAARQNGNAVQSIGICVPGISNTKQGTVWVPNIAGWKDYPLMMAVRAVAEGLPVVIESDRTAYISGEIWQGNARGCTDAIYLSVGTGIGAGIIVNGSVLRGAHDIGGAIGWMSLNKTFEEGYIRCGCFEFHASGEGIAAQAGAMLEAEGNYSGILKQMEPKDITSHHVFSAFENGDSVAVTVIDECIGYWGRAVANLVSLFNPEKIVLGGGVFGPGIPLIPRIQKEALKWAQPVSATQYKLEASGLGNDAGLYGSAYLALQNLNASCKAQNKSIE